MPTYVIFILPFCDLGVMENLYFFFKLQIGFNQLLLIYVNISENIIPRANDFFVPVTKSLSKCLELNRSYGNI